MHRLISQPPSVLQAILKGDISTLSALGKKGAETRKRNRRDDARRMTYRLLLDLRLREEQANEHICPPD